VAETIAPGRDDRRREVVLVGLMAAIAGTAALVATRHGIALSPDSVSYLSAARNLAAGHGYLDFTGTADTTFPPLFPAAIAAGNVVGFSLTTSARLVNASSFAVIVVLSWALLRRHVDSTVVRVTALIAIACSPVLLDVSAKAWSEPLFCAFLLAFLLVIERAVCSVDARLRLVAAAGLISGAAFLVRYVGVSLIITGVVVCTLLPLGTSIRRRAERTLVFVLAAAPLPAIWALRNAGSGAQHLLGPRVALPGSPWIVVREFVVSAASLVALPRAPLVFVVCAVPIGVVAILGARAASRREGLVDQRRQLIALAPVFVFIAVYIPILLVAGKMSGASVDARTVMPLFVPLVVVVAGFADLARTESRSRAVSGRRRSYRAAMVVGSATTYLVVMGLVFATTAWADGRTARGYGSATARPSTVEQAVRGLDARALVVTNHPWTLYVATGHQPVLPTPRPLYPSVSIAPATTDQISDALCTRSVYLAWFTRGVDAAGPPNLGSDVSIEALSTQTDGTVYRVIPSASTSSRSVDGHAECPVTKSG